MSQNKSLREEKPILALIQDIKDGRTSAKLLSREMRQGCIEVLIGEGYNVPQIAQILKRCDKTIRRDLEDIRKRNAMTPNVELAKMIIGEMMTHARTHREYLMRLARKADASVSEKAQAEYLAHRANMETIQRLQSLGCLPTQPQAVIGSFYHNISKDEALKKFEEINAEALEVEQVFKDCEIDDPQVKDGLLNIKKALKKHPGAKKDEGEDGKR